MSDDKLCKATLPNGLRVLVERRPEMPRTAVCVHYGVGYRSEAPGKEGFAHLFEHLMFRGSENLPDGSFFDHIHRLGGTANGTTHQDYTDYHQVVPTAALEQALFAEADRMRAPRFTSRSLTDQLRGIEVEIHEAVTGRPYGGFPWPALPRVLFRRFANAHDGYGLPERLRQITPDDCVEFFDRHYAPCNAVVSVVGDHQPRDVLALVERHFGGIPPRPVLPRPDAHEPELTENRYATCTEPEVSATALAVGYRLPNPQTDLRDYLAYAVLAEMVDQGDMTLPDAYGLSASCGIFGLLDARAPDALVVTTLTPPHVPPRRVVETLTQRWADWADDPALGERHAWTVRRMVAGHLRDHADVYARCRALGRMETLFGRAELVDEIPRLLTGVGTEHVAHAASRLHLAAKAVLAMVPGPIRTRPEPEYASDPASTDTCQPNPAVRQAAGTPPGLPRTFPPLGAQPRPRCAPRRDTMVGGGLRVVAVQDMHAPLVELRLRLPVGDSGRRRPEAVEALVRHLNERTGAADARRFPGALEVSADHQWFDVSGYAAPDDLCDWLVVLADILTPLELVGPPHPAPLRHLDPERLLDEVLLRRLAGGLPLSALTPASVPCDLGALHRSITEAGVGTLIAVGPVDPARFTAEAERVLPRVAPAASATGGQARWTGEGLALIVEQDGARNVHLALSALEPAGDDEPARYLATALVGAHYRSRLAERLLRTGLQAQVYAGRDVFLDLPRVYIRATASEQDAAATVAVIHQELCGLADAPVSPAELEPVRTFCAGQMLSAFDSPRSKADLLCSTLSAGRPPGWLDRLADLLRETTAARVAAASAQLFSPRGMALVASGRSGPVADLAGEWSRRSASDGAVAARTTNPE